MVCSSREAVKNAPQELIVHAVYDFEYFVEGITGVNDNG
jgi:hypothetical protein